MAKQLDFRDYYYLRGDNVVHRGSGYFQLPIGGELSMDDTTAKMRYNNDDNTVCIGMINSWIKLTDRSDSSTYIVRTGDSMLGDLRFDPNARILGTAGNNTTPSYTFLYDQDTGMYNNSPNSLSFVVGASINSTDVIKIERVNASDTGTNIYLEGSVYMDDLSFRRRDGLQLDGDYAYFTGNIGLRLPIGTTSDRHIDPTGLIRLNSESDSFEFGFQNDYLQVDSTNHAWGSLSLDKNKSSWMVKSGDSMVGDLEFINDARLILNDGAAIRPSLTFSSDNTTGIYKFGDSIGLVLQSNINIKPAIEALRTGSGGFDNLITINGLLSVDTIEVANTVTMDSNKISLLGNGITLPMSNNSITRVGNGIVSYNTDANAFELYHQDTRLFLSGMPNTDAWISRKGDSISGDLTFLFNKKIYNSFGDVFRPAYSFLNDEDSGIYRANSDTLGIMVGGDINRTPAVIVRRHGVEDLDKTVTINGDLRIAGNVSVTGRGLNRTDRYLFRYTIPSNDSYTIDSSECGNSDLIDSVVDIKVLESDNTSPVYGMYTRCEDLVLGCVQESITIHNTTSVDKDIRVVVIVVNKLLLPDGDVDGMEYGFTDHTGVQFGFNDSGASIISANEG